MARSANLRKGFTALAITALILLSGCSEKPPFLPTTSLFGYQAPIITATHIIEDSAQTLENFALHPSLKAAATYLPDARGVFILPRLRDYGIAAGFKIGPGVLLVRTRDGTWSGPSFHDLYSSDIIPYLTNHNRGAVVIFRSGPVLDAVIQSNGQLNAAPEAEVGVVNAINHVSPLYNEDVNILVFAASDTAELMRRPFAAASIPADKELNEGLYGRGATPNAIFYGVVGEPATNHYPATTRRLRTALGP